MNTRELIQRATSMIQQQNSLHQGSRPETEETPDPVQAEHIHVSQDDEDEILANLGIEVRGVRAEEPADEPSTSQTQAEDSSEEEPVQETQESAQSDGAAENEETQENTEVQVHEPVVSRENLTRFSGADWFEECQSHTAIIAGQGGIGTYVTFLMSRLNLKALYIYDNDRVEANNLAGQLYRQKDIGKFKVEAIADTVKEYSYYTSLFTSNTRFDYRNDGNDIMLCGFDNMVARQIFFHKWKKYVQNLPAHERKKCLYVDGRLTAELLQVFCIRGDEPYFMDKYETDFLFSDDEVTINAPCTLKQTAFMANMIGSLMVNCYVNHCAILANPDLPRRLPFYTEYNAKSMTLQQDEMIL